jgi:hypothetical protein
MSESQAQSHSPAPSATKTTPKRKRSVLLWLLVLLLALCAFGAALWYAGGTDALGQLSGLVNSLIPSFGGSPSTQQPAPVAPVAVATSTPTVLPPEAQQRMFAEQLASQGALSGLAHGKIASLSLGKSQQGAALATVPVTATYVDGRKVSGVITFKKYGGTWYFFSLTDATPGQSGPASPPQGFDSGVVQTITTQQALPGTQELITQGIFGGGFTTATVNGVTMGPRTSTVDVTLSGGTQPESKGRLVCISQTDGSTTYWFVASFEKR